MEQGFFDAGGNSLIIPRLRQAISGAFGVDIGMTGVFKYSSLRSLTAFVLHELRSEDETRAKNKAANSAGSVRYGVGLAASPGGTDRHDLQRAARRERKQQRIRQ